MRILITGSNGFLGSHLTTWLTQRGHLVTGTARHPTPGQIRFELGTGFDQSLVRGFDAVIHGAHDFDSAERTVQGTQELFRAVREKGERPRQLFISSYSARPDAVSEYGQTKYCLERMFLEAGETVIRPGLVIGNGGLFGRNLQRILSSRVIPLIDGGHDEVPVLSIADLTALTEQLVETASSGAWNLFHPVIPTMRQIVEAVATEAGQRVIVVPVPAAVAMTAVRAMARIGIRLPFREDNLQSLQANRRRIHESDVAKLDVTPQDLREAVSSALRNMRYARKQS